jgi:hypothetical protein
MVPNITSLFKNTMSRASKKIKDTQNQLIIARKEPTWPTNAMRSYQWHANCKQQRQPPTYAERNTCQKGLLQKERIFERQHRRIKLAKSWFFSSETKFAQCNVFNIEMARIAQLQPMRVKGHLWYLRPSTQRAPSYRHHLDKLKQKKSCF